MGLVHYPATEAPETGSVVVVAVCADNAHIISFSMLMECLYNGTWIISDFIQPPIAPQCQCDEGYHKASVDGRMICQGENISLLLCCTIHLEPYTHSQLIHVRQFQLPYVQLRLMD